MSIGKPPRRPRALAAPVRAEGAAQRSGRGLPERPLPATTERVLTGKLITLGDLLLRSASEIYRERFDMRREEWRIIALLGSNESLPLKELARRAGLKKSQISRGVGQLVDKRMLSRVAGPHDAREARLHLTARGQAIHDAIVATAVGRSAVLTEGLDADQTARLHALVELMIARARAMTAGG